MEIGIPVSFMIRGGCLSSEDRADLIALTRDGSAAHRLARRANALVLLDDGWSCERVAAALFVDDETVRRWRQLFLEDGLEGLTRFESGLCQEDAQASCCTRDGGGSFEVAL